MIFEKRHRWPSSVNDEAPPPNSPRCPQHGDWAITFVNHATFLIQRCGLNILTDPVWSERVGPVSWVGPRRIRKPGIPFEKLPPIDLVLISHNHYDHLDVPTLKRINRHCGAEVLVPLGDRRLLEAIGSSKVRELDWYQEIAVHETLKITFTPAQHFSGRSLWGRQKSLWGGYMIENEGLRIFFAGDAAYSNHFSDIRRRLGSPDIALLGIGSYEPRWFMKAMHMNPLEAVQAHRDLIAKQSIGMHFGTFRMSAGAEGSEQPQLDLCAALAEAQIEENKFTTLEHGETRFYGVGQL